MRFRLTLITNRKSNLILILLAAIYLTSMLRDVYAAPLPDQSFPRNISFTDGAAGVKNATFLCISTDCRTSWPAGAIQTVSSSDSYISVVNGSSVSISANLTSFDARYALLSSFNALYTNLTTAQGNISSLSVGLAAVNSTVNGHTTTIGGLYTNVSVLQTNVTDLGIGLTNVNTTALAKAGTGTATCSNGFAAMNVTTTTAAPTVQCVAVGTGNGSVTSVATGDGLTGGTITTTGTISVSATTSGTGNYSYWNGTAWLTRPDNYTTGASVTGTTTKTLQLSQNGGNNVSASWTDADTTYTNGTGINLTSTTFSLSPNGGTAGTYGSASQVAVCIQDIYGRVSCSNTPISINGSAINDWPGACPEGTAMVAINDTGGTTTIYCDPTITGLGTLTGISGAINPNGSLNLTVTAGTGNASSTGVTNYLSRFDTTATTIESSAVYDDTNGKIALNVGTATTLSDVFTIRNGTNINPAIRYDNGVNTSIYARTEYGFNNGAPLYTVDIIPLNTSTGVTARFFRSTDTTGAAVVQVLTANNTATANAQIGANTNSYFCAVTGNCGIGDTSPDALFTVGSSDMFRINSTGDVLVSSDSSTTTNPRIIGFTEYGGTEAVMFRVGDAANALRATNGGRMQMYTYWGMELGGAQQAASGLSTWTTGSANDAAITILSPSNSTATSILIASKQGNVANGGYAIAIANSTGGNLQGYINGSAAANFSEITVQGVSGTGKVVCVKSNADFGVCSDAVNATGQCTCA